MGYVTTVSDPEKRPTVEPHSWVGSRILSGRPPRLCSEGLVLMTNDGTLAHKLMKAASHVAKTYVVKVSGKPTERRDRESFAAGFRSPPMTAGVCAPHPQKSAW